ncbi:hypothetical protein F2Q70_00035163 [Brassica cretica]|uniref:Vta1/callose synthase N-terminal domain-containing protein n=1 Tax=Brassica cretica TaxID=69181 RepID=A0A8S9JQP5_BRACR|nr:hypothetical protein F2Q70_00035163 [Brassica cretica]
MKHSEKHGNCQNFLCCKHHIFFEILSQFGPVPPDIEQKQKYAAWKAADIIRKAIKEGRKPTPGDPVDDESDSSSIPSSAPNGSYDLGASDTNIEQSLIHPMNPKMNVHPPPPSSYPSNDLIPPPTGPSNSPYHQDLPPSQNYPSHEPSPISLPNFQSYPSFSDSSLPATPSLTHYQNPESYYSAPSSTSFTSSPPYSSSNGRNNIAPVLEHAPSPAQKIAEAHKAARFAVGAFSFR